MLLQMAYDDGKSSIQCLIPRIVAYFIQDNP